MKSSGIKFSFWFSLWKWRQYLKLEIDQCEVLIPLSTNRQHFLIMKLISEYIYIYIYIYIYKIEVSHETLRSTKG